jgi:hypothetical protein
MISTVLVYLCTELECFLQDWHAFHRVGGPLYRVEMLSRGLKCFPDGWNAFYRVGMLSRGLECFLQGCHAFHIVGGPFVQG